MKSYKVALIAHCYHESSARHKLTFLAQNTALRLISPQFYPYSYGRFEIDYEFNQEVAVSSFPIHFLSFRPTSTRWILASRDLGFREFQPDIIHVENEQHSFVLCQALLYRKLYAPSAKIVDFSWNNIDPQKGDRKGQVLEHLAAINRRFVDFFICGNVAGREILEARGVAARKIEVIPQFGVDTRMFYPFASDLRVLARQSLGITPGDFAIGFVGRFVEEKGILDLVEAASRLSAGSSRSPVLIFMGQGPLEDQIRARCAQLGTKLHILPPRKNHEVAEVINVLDVLVLPSQSRPFWKEQFGRVLTEAMACGVPVIGSDSGEIPNVIGDAGLIFREADRDALNRCLQVYYEDDKLRREYGDCGRTRVLNHFTNERIAERTLAIYEQMTR